MRLFRLIACVFVVAAGVASRAEEADPERWEKAIQAFEQADRESPPPKGTVLFVGSSSIRLWNLGASFPEKPYINRGFGGSQFHDATYFVDRIVTPHSPAHVVAYSGDNDIAAGKSAEETFAACKSFIDAVHTALPKTSITIIAIKPSIARRELMDEMAHANALIAAHCDADDLLQFVDIFTPMLDESGEPRKELFVEDGLHLNAMGYELWTSLVKPVLAHSG